ncbi:cytochrome c3 family protein [Sulfuriroseicoccus oceanibius]|uniref:Cytochrome c3 family protein n=1 Tax=Sulfuriroseicoccus oceanibius TaxID=2707525 RepID=A0A6B3LB16_9BACT|nr:cytochrome c3 family protein [Sulfuriroseicoccus oceanibius]
MANLFPRSSNFLPIKIGLFVGVVGITLALGFTYYGTPKYTRVGYAPDQPVPFSHKLHAGELGLDCRYCHSNVTESNHSNIPPVSTCMNCHEAGVKTQSDALAVVRDAAETGKSLEWVQIHETADYVFFDHSAHVNSGIGCVSCHGRIDQMEKVFHAENHSMGWCLECHREPEKHLRPIEQVTNLAWTAADHPPVMVDGELKQLTQEELGLMLKDQWRIDPPETCGGCHR